MTNPTISIFFFCYGSIPAPCLNAHLNLHASTIVEQRHSSMIMIREDALISRSRSRATGLFLQKKHDVMVMIDHDIEFRPEDVWRIADLALEQEAIIGTPYSKRGLALGHAGRHTGPLPEPGTDCLTDTIYLGTGFMAFSRSTLKKIAAKCEWASDPKYGQFPAAFLPIVHENEYLSEDYSFCQRAKQVQIPSLAWTGPQLKHWGMYGFEL